MCLGDNFFVSEVSSFFPVASFVLGFFLFVCLFAIYPLMIKTRITASCHLAWPHPGLAEKGKE